MPIHKLIFPLPTLLPPPRILPRPTPNSALAVTASAVVDCRGFPLTPPRAPTPLSRPPRPRVHARSLVLHPPLRIAIVRLLSQVLVVSKQTSDLITSPLSLPVRLPRQILRGARHAKPWRGCDPRSQIIRTLEASKLRVRLRAQRLTPPIRSSLTVPRPARNRKKEQRSVFFLTRTQVRAHVRRYLSFLSRELFLPTLLISGLADTPSEMGFLFQIPANHRTPQSDSSRKL